MKRSRRSRGFTMMEALIAVALVAILSGLAVVGTAAYRRSLRQLELDGIAKEIFVAAQNRLTLAESQGYLGRTDFGSRESIGGNVFYLMAGTADDPDDENGVLNLMLPFGAIDESLRSGGSYIIRYQVNPAQVLDVFYAEPDDTRYGHTFSADEYGTLMGGYSGADRKSARSAYGPHRAVLGYYGGGEISGLTRGEPLEAPMLQVINGEKLYAIVTNPNASIGNAALKLVVTGVTSGVSREIQLVTAGTYGTRVATLPNVTIGGGNTFTVILDDITEAGLHFSELFCDDVILDNLIPGEDVVLQAVAYNNHELTNVGYSVEKTANSLFAGLGESGAARISNIRHLENLSWEISGVSAMITAAEQTGDLSWPEFVENMDSTDVRVYSAEGIASSAGMLLPVNPISGFSYDGGGYSISGVKINVAGNAGVFGALTGGTVTDLELVDFSVSGGNAGALAGQTNGTRVSGVLVRNGSGDASGEISGSDSAGGLIGDMSGGSVEECAAAVYVRSGGYAGGLIGSANGAAIHRSYSGGHTVNGHYLAATGDGTTGRMNVIGDIAGGLVGRLDSGSVQYCYSTCSASGTAAAGGFAGNVASSSVADCYAVGLVCGGTAGSFAGVAVNGGIAGCFSLEIINEDVLPLGSGSGGVEAIDKDTAGYTAFIRTENSSAAAAWSYDVQLRSEFGGKYYFKTVEQLSGVSSQYHFIGSHYGDWPVPDMKIVNSRTLGSLISYGGESTAEAVYLSHAPEAAIPDSAVLSAVEIPHGTDEYEYYARSAAETLGTQAESFTSVRVVDISILNQGEELQPQSTVSVALCLADLAQSGSAQVVHFGSDTEVMDADIDSGMITFETSGFSVYVIFLHDTDESSITSRITYHFIDHLYTMNGDGSYKAAPYRFLNTHGEYQTTQIIRDGESLELIANPPNGNDGYYYGWYIVDLISEDENGIIYRWPADPQRVEFGRSIAVTEDADVYLAPIYTDYHFVNFHEVDYAVNANGNLLTRKLAVLGSDGKAEISVSDIHAKSTDSVRLIFRGWQYKRPGDAEWTRIQTIDDTGAEISQSITVNRGDGTIELYPYFQEGRWLYFDVGGSGNGAQYIPAQFLLAAFEGSDGAAVSGGVVESLPVTSRPGYTFDGWYVSSAYDSEGNLLENVQVTDSSGKFLADLDIHQTGEYLNKEADSYTIRDGKLTIRNALSGLTFHAKWTADRKTQYYVYYWQQNAGDEDYTLHEVEVVEGQIPGETTDVGSNTEVSNRYSAAHFKLSEDQDKTADGVQPEIVEQTIDGDGRTVVNVYYDRCTYKLRFYFAREYTSGGRTYLQINNNNEAFRNYNGNGGVQGALTSLGSSRNDYADGMTGGTVWRSVTTTNPVDLLDADWLARSGVAFDENVHYEAVDDVTTWVFTSSSTPSRSSSVDMKYYYVELSVRYGQSMNDIWPTSASFTTAVASTGNVWTNIDNDGNFTVLLVGARKNSGIKDENGNGGNITGIYSVLNETLFDSENKEDGGVAHMLVYWRNEDYHTYTYVPYYSLLSGEHSDDPNGGNYAAQPSFKVDSGESIDTIEALTFEGVTHTNAKRVSGTTVRFYYARNEYAIHLRTGAGQYDVVETDGTDVTDAVRDIEGVPYGERIAVYAATPDNYVVDVTTRTEMDGKIFVFKGWYDNPAFLGEPYDFSGTEDTMPDHALAFYARWEEVTFLVSIDPNGGVIDHMDHAAAGFGTGHNTTQVTYYETSFGTAVDKYTPERGYIEISKDDNYTGDVYYYLNTVYKGGTADGERGLPPDLRNAVYLTEDELALYYAYYLKVISENSGEYPGITPYGTLTEFKEAYVTKENGDFVKYRPLNQNEEYILIDWYEVLPDGELSESPFSFVSRTANSDVEIRATWRVQGNFYIAYDPTYTTPFGAVVTGQLMQTTDPVNKEQKHNDQSPTIIAQQPTGITYGYIFRGWRLVRQSGGSDENKVYTPLEDGVYYDPGQGFVVDSRYADETGCIHMQAYYEKVDASYRRPGYAALSLDANGGRVDQTNGEFPAWQGVGTVTADEAANRVRFAYIQSNIAVELSRYADFFEHEDKYFLLGFDKLPTEGDYIAEFTADAVVGVQRRDDKTVYAVWEPMVYVTFVNQTGTEISIDISATGTNTLHIVNQVTGRFDRVPVEDASAVKVPAGESVKLVMPQGRGGTDTFTASVINTHENYLLSVQSEFTGMVNDLAEKVKYGEAAVIKDTLQYDPVGVIVTYTEEESYRVTYDVNSGTWTDTPGITDVNEDGLPCLQFDPGEQIIEPNTPAAPSDGLTLLGWTTNKAVADRTDFSDDLEAVRELELWDFDDPAYGSLTLYAVWAETVTVTFDLRSRTGFVGTFGNLHSWDSANDTDYYKGTGYRRTAAVIKGDTVKEPIPPAYYSSSDYAFYHWATDSSYIRTAQKLESIPANLQAELFNFSQPVTRAVTLYTSWLDASETDMVVTVEKKVVNPAGSGGEFRFTATVTECTYSAPVVCMNNGNVHFFRPDGDPELVGTRVLSEFTFVLRDGEQYEIPLRIVTSRSNWDENNSATVTWIVQTVTLREEEYSSYETSYTVNGIEFEGNEYTAMAAGNPTELVFSGQSIVLGKDGLTYWKEYSVAVAEDVTVTCTNTRIAVGSRKVILKKVNTVYDVLPGAVFDLEGPDGVIAGLASDENGIIFVGDLPYGTYYLTEMTAPAGYAKPGDPYVIVVAESGVTVTKPNK